MVPTEMAIDAGTVILGMILDTLTGRSPLYRLEEFFEHQDTELLLGKKTDPLLFSDYTVGRVLDRIYDYGTIKLSTMRSYSISKYMTYNGIKKEGFIYIADSAMVTRKNLEKI